MVRRRKAFRQLHNGGGGETNIVGEALGKFQDFPDQSNNLAPVATDKNTNPNQAPTSSRDPMASMISAPKDSDYQGLFSGPPTEQDEDGNRLDSVDII